MKRRRGFVANSSSSSFIIAFKGEVDYDKLDKKMGAILGINEGSPIYNLVGKMSDVFTDDIEEYTTYESFKEDYDYEYEDGRNIKDIFIKYDVVCFGSVDSDSCEPAETIICGAELDYEDDEILVYKKETH